MQIRKIPKQQIPGREHYIPKIKIPELESLRPMISFEFIDGMTGGCLESLYKKQRTNTKGKLKELQVFINEFSKYDNVDKAIQTYSGKGQTINNKFVSKIINSLQSNHRSLTGINEDELLHIHAKRNGKGETVYFGFRYENVFHIVYIDSNHSFNKRKK